MTQELITIWQELHGYNRLDAMLELKLLTDLLANEKASAPTEADNTQPTPILPQVEEDENQLSLIYEEDGLHVQTL